MELLPIAGSKGFTISSDGKVFDSKGRRKNTSINGDGYITTNVKLTNNQWVTFGVHRLVALTFLKDREENQTEVNHRDCELKNIDKSNLEWVTPSQNNIHSEIMRDRPNKPSLYVSLNGIPQKLFMNAKEAAEEYECGVLEIWD